MRLALSTRIVLWRFSEMAAATPSTLQAPGVFGFNTILTLKEAEREALESLP
jgi:hypothetical protein